mmetsp:Transcript_23703/g.66474  ORF Transcript_23703/g.66474 Transcript_23703/m.66474 type:complete len:336 (+) Transcript_23703:88-1095(+)
MLILLLCWSIDLQVGGINLLVACYAAMALYVAHKMVFGRLPYLTWERPELPIGHVRKVKLDKERARRGMLPLSTYGKAYWTVLSVFIVPYESMVIYIDTLVTKQNAEDSKVAMKEKRSKGYVLSPQERTHSRIHSEFNKEMVAAQHPLMRFFLAAVFYFYHYSTLVLKTLVPTLVNGIVTVFENGFYYERTVEEIFEEFSDDTTLSRIYLWHLYEELEHHQESVQLFHDYYGPLLGSLITVSIVPLLQFLLHTINVFALLATFLSLNVAAYPTAVTSFLYDLVQNEVMTIWSSSLVLAKASSDKKKIAADLANYRLRFSQKYGISLEPSKEFLVL